MIENNIKIPQIVAVILDAFALVMVLVMIQGQQSILPLYMGGAHLSVHVFPLRTVLTIVFRLVLFLSCLFTMLYYKGEHRRIVSLIFIALFILHSVASPYISMAANALTAKKGVDYLSAYSSLTSAIGLCTGPLSAVSTALFFIACGRYGISETEDTFDPNNYIQP